MLTNPKSSAFPWSGVIALVLLLLVIFLPLSALLSQAQNLDLLTMGQDAYLWHILQFSLLQAGLSGLISIFVGFWIARALFRRGQFWGHQWVLGLMGLPLVIPAIVVVLAMVATFGHQGLFPLGDNLYGLRGILLAHVFFNIPLAVRLLLPAWQGISAHYWQLGLELNFSPWDYFRHLEWPSLKGHIPRVFLLIFLLCFTSFAVVLGLGGGPQSATLEVAIYEALRFELDFAKGAVLALVQLFITGILAFWLVQWPQSQEQRHSGQLTLSLLRGWTDYPWILFAATLVLLPLGLLFADLFQQDLWQILGQDALVKASLTSISLALTAATFALIWGWVLAFNVAKAKLYGHRFWGQTLESATALAYVIPPLVLGMGFFIWLFPLGWTLDSAWFLVMLINGLMGLTFVVRTLEPQIRQVMQTYDPLKKSLHFSALDSWRWIYWPLLRPAMGLSLALVMALSLGDLGVIALFGSEQTTTLPLLIYQRLAAYQIPQAMVLSAYLLVMCLLFFYAIERLFQGKAAHDLLR